MNVNAYNADPKQWGPHVWATIHTLALRSDSTGDIDAYQSFLRSLQDLLPCDTCKTDYTKWMKHNGGPTKNNAFEWSVNLHNYVNSKLGKTTVSLEDAKSAWTMSNCSYSCKNEQPTKPSMSLYVLVVILILLLVVLSRL